MKLRLLVKLSVIKYPAIIASISLLHDLHVALKLYNAGIHPPNIALYVQNQSKNRHSTSLLSFLFYQTGHLEDESTAYVVKLSSLTVSDYTSLSISVNWSRKHAIGRGKQTWRIKSVGELMSNHKTNSSKVLRADKIKQIKNRVTDLEGRKSLQTNQNNLTSGAAAMLQNNSGVASFKCYRPRMEGYEFQL